MASCQLLRTSTKHLLHFSYRSIPCSSLRLPLELHLTLKSNTNTTQTFRQQHRAMATSTATTDFFNAVKTRRTNYQLTNKSTISDEQVEKIVADAIANVPSAFNVQSARAVILFGDHHRKLWDLGKKHMKTILPAEKFAYFEAKIQGLQDAHGTVMFFEDQAALDKLAENQPSVKSEIVPWSQNSAGMHHFTVWTALSLEGLGANLQHYNMVPAFAKEVTETWDLPEAWKLNAQLVFGTPSAPSGEKKISPVEPRIKVIA